MFKYPTILPLFITLVLAFIFLTMRSCTEGQIFESQQSDIAKLRMSSCSTKSLLQKLEDIDENGPASWLPVSCAAPETPTESMEFLARSWSVSAMELSKALSNTHVAIDNVDKASCFCSAEAEALDASSTTSKESFPSGGSTGSPPISPRDSEEMKVALIVSPLVLLWNAPEQLKMTHLTHRIAISEFGILSQLNTKLFLYTSNSNKCTDAGIILTSSSTHSRISFKSAVAKKWAIQEHIKRENDGKMAEGSEGEEEAGDQNPKCSSELAATQQKTPSKLSSAVASAAALVASHCIEIAEDMGADHDQILTVVNSAINARTNGDVMTLTAGAATDPTNSQVHLEMIHNDISDVYLMKTFTNAALRGAATLRARMQKGPGTTAFVLGEEKGEEDKEANITAALNFVTKGGELLKRTRKGALHWKRVSFNINSNWQVIVKMKSKHMGGTFTKKKKCVVSGVYTDILAWPGRDKADWSGRRAYFAIKTVERVIEFECSKADKQMWTEGIQHMLNCRTSLT
ncbi:hypothetical protein POTOM_056993 [Populus tomentosa]|uniref:PH domain-containing protein n=1 Tax=Populus tomentosa TaxID=118781 RepID=A0A8X7XYX1_POPTO|nr:hypothetical protein POTOM_056993 [Populus tomentosa]